MCFITLAPRVFRQFKINESKQNMNSSVENKKVWFVTGASKGLGLSLVKKLLSEGYRVAATSRNVESLIAAVKTQTKNFLPLQVDLTDEQSVENAVESTRHAFGEINVVVNNAGYGIGGTIEELSRREIRESFDVNVFAALNVIKKAMPVLRAQRSGHIINIASIAGFAAATGWAIYAAAKFAVVGLSEVLAEDVQEFGIKVTVVEPGAFRTNFLAAESLTIAVRPIADYTNVRQSHAKYLKMDGTQIGDPEKAAAAFIELAENPNPPVRLFLGSDAYERATQKVKIIKDELEIWRDTTVSTDYK